MPSTWVRPRSFRRSPIQACEAAVAPPSRPASSGKLFSMHPANQKCVTCNADEGDSGTFADRMLMEGDPFVLIEGMTIAASRWAPHKAISTCASNIPTRIVRCREAIDTAYQRRLSRRQHPRQRKAIRSRGSRWVPEPTSAAKRPRCSRASKASGVRYGHGLPCRPSRDSSGCPPSSTT